MKSAENVSVVIPTYNSAQTIALTVEKVLNQTLRPSEVVIVDDGSTDDTADVLKNFAGRIRVVRQDNRGPAAARNRGVLECKGDYVAFTDSDCVPDENWLRNLMNGFDSENVAGVGGTVRRAFSGIVPEYIDSISIMNPALNSNRDVVYLITANACFQRKVLLQAGLFDERFRKPGGEEPELCYRIAKLGYKFGLVENAVVYHHHPQDLKSFISQMVKYGEGAATLKHIWPEYALNPVSSYAKALRPAIALKSILRTGSHYKEQLGWGKGFLFSALDHLRAAAFQYGYVKGSRNLARLVGSTET